MLKAHELERRRLQHIFDSLTEAVLVCDVSGVIQSCNMQARKILDVADVQGVALCDLFSVFSKELLAEMCANYRKFCNVEPSSSPSDYTAYLATQDLLAKPHSVAYKEKSLVLTINVLSADPEDEAFSFLVSLDDVTSEVTSTKALNQYKSSLFGLLSIIPVPTFYKDLDSKFSDTNPQFQKLLGLDNSDILGKTNGELFSPSTAEQLDELDREVLSSDSVRSKTLDLEFLNGLIQSAKVYGRSINDGTSITGTAGSIVVDTEEQIRNNLFTLSARSIVFCARDRKIVGCNDEFVRLCGFQKSDVIGSACTDPKFDTLFSGDPGPHSVDLITYNNTLLDRVRMCIDNELDVHSEIYVFFTHLPYLDR